MHQKFTTCKMLSLTTCIYAEHEQAAVIIGCDRNWSQVWLICSSSSLSIPTTLLQFEPCLKQTHLFRFTIHILCSIGTSWRCILLCYPENYNYRLLSSLLIMNVGAERINRTNLFHGNVWNLITLILRTTHHLWCQPSKMKRSVREKSVLF